jgi:hypothetical protein
VGVGCETAPSGLRRDDDQFNSLSEPRAGAASSGIENSIYYTRIDRRRPITAHHVPPGDDISKVHVREI